MMKAFPATIWKIGTRTTVKPLRAPKDTPVRAFGSFT
jgi:hypothetical protein